MNSEIGLFLKKKGKKKFRKFWLEWINNILANLAITGRARGEKKKKRNEQSGGECLSNYFKNHIIQ